MPSFGRSGSPLEKRTGRERMALAIMVATVAAALWIQLLWTAHQERARHTKTVAELQLQNAAMKQAKDAMQSARTQGACVL